MIVLVSVQQPVAAWQIPPEQVDRLRLAFPHHEIVYARSDAERAAGLSQCEVAYTWILSPAELDAAPRLRWLHSSAVAVGTLCLDALAARGVTVTNTRGVQGGPIAEHVFATLLALTHRLPLALDRQRERLWAQNEFVGPRLPVLLSGLCLGVVGLGSIGTEVARLGAAFGMRVVGIRRHPERGAPECVQAVWGADRLDDLAAAADVLVVAAPLTGETETLLDARRVGRMKKGAWLVNVSRGQLVDAAALVAALEAGALAGAALDVFAHEPLPADSPLWRAPNLLITPHTSGFRRGHWDDAVEVFIDNLGRWDRGAPLLWPVEPARGY
ncbi:MAG: D-2-hydroxyacid dehydrogenase [Acidobacteriota bacterium]